MKTPVIPQPQNSVFMSKSVGVLFLFLLLGSCGSPQGAGCAARTAPGILGQSAPNFVLPRLEGGEANLAEIVSQKPTLLVFWATWCPSCIEEIPLLNEWAEKYPQLQILGIDVQESRERVGEFLKKREVRYPILLDEEAEVASQYGLVGIPATLLLAKGGRVIYYGFSLPENIEELVHA